MGQDEGEIGMSRSKRLIVEPGIGPYGSPSIHFEGGGKIAEMSHYGTMLDDAQRLVDCWNIFSECISVRLSDEDVFIVEKYEK